MQRRSGTLTLGSNPIVSLGTDRRLIDFEETRFRVHALKLQNTLRPLAAELSTELGVPLSTLEQLSAESEADLKRGTYCAFDFLDVNTKRERGFLKVRWIPFAVFVGGVKVFSLHASYSDGGSKLSGLTMRREGQEEYTRCTTDKSALKVGRSFLRTYVVQGNS
jgi:hypothetical protein